jgi:hypothetical protein
MRSSFHDQDRKAADPALAERGVSKSLGPLASVAVVLLAEPQIAIPDVVRLIEL